METNNNNNNNNNGDGGGGEGAKKGELNTEKVGQGSLGEECEVSGCKRKVIISVSKNP